MVYVFPSCVFSHCVSLYCVSSCCVSSCCISSCCVSSYCISPSHCIPLSCSCMFISSSRLVRWLSLPMLPCFLFIPGLDCLCVRGICSLFVTCRDSLFSGNPNGLPVRVIMNSGRRGSDSILEDSSFDIGRFVQRGSRLCQSVCYNEDERAPIESLGRTS